MFFWGSPAGFKGPGAPHRLGSAHAPRLSQEGVGGRGPREPRDSGPI